MHQLPDPENIDIVEIMKLIPHRYPFLLVDRIKKIVEGKEVVGIKNVTINEPFFQGHFPDKPVMPGVLILEGLAQVGCIYTFYSQPEEVGKKIMYFAGINKARFRKPVVPGDQLVYHLELVRQKRSVTIMAASAYVDDVLVAEAEMMSSLNDK